MKYKIFVKKKINQFLLNLRIRQVHKLCASARLFVCMFLCIFFTQHSLANEKPAVFVSIVPQKFFVRQISKNLVDVHVMVQPGASPAVYEPKPGQMKAVSKAALYFAIGIPFEKTWLKKICLANPKIKVIHTDHFIQKISMSSGSLNNRDHHSNIKDHKILDPHIWTSPPLVMLQARVILAALREADPKHKLLYEDNYREFITQLVALDIELMNIFTGKERLQFIVFHPSWGYFAHTYGLEQISLEIQGKAPKPAMMTELIKEAKKKNIKFVFVQPQFSSRSAQQIAKAIQGTVLFADPLAENWSENLIRVANKFKSGLNSEEGK